MSEPRHLVAGYWGHDSSLTFWNDVTKTFHIIEIEKLTGIKHYRGHHRRGDEEKEVYQKAIEIAEREFGIPNDYYAFIAAGHDPKTQIDDKTDWRYVMPCNENTVCSVFNVKNYVNSVGHHLFHATSGFMQSPFEKAVVISMDGGGTEGFQFVYTAEDRKTPLPIQWMTKERANSEIFLGRQYNRCARWICYNMLQVTPCHSDFSGKVMGASAYGDRTSEAYRIARSLFENNKETWNKYTRENDWFRFYLGTREEILKDPGVRDRRKRLMIQAFWETPENYNPYRLMAFPVDWQTECDYSLGIQEKFEQMSYAWITKMLKDINLDDYDRNVVMSGGVALNVIFNAKLREKLNINLFVPPNPTDVGLSHGALADYMLKNKVDFDVRNVTYSTFSIQDKDKLSEYVKSHNGRLSSIKEVAQLLRDQKIIGFVQGNIEVGPRALGNRSILCDPQGPDKKDLVNKVKRREAYRPFAPMCRREDVEKYFESSNYEHLSHMNIAVRTRPEYVDQIAAATHVDGTARIQTVTHEENENIYNLLTEFDGVLLNTSFNVAGKPILNTYEEAFYVLDNTPLDNLVIVDDNNQVWVF